MKTKEKKLQTLKEIEEGQESIENEIPEIINPDDKELFEE